MPIAPEDLVRYPPDWPRIARAVKAGRAGWRCECTGQCGEHPGQRCPRRQGDPAAGRRRCYRITLTVAHLDHTPEHNDPGNLLAMCQGCHLRYDVAHHCRTRVRRELDRLEAAGQLALVLAA